MAGGNAFFADAGGQRGSGPRDDARLHRAPGTRRRGRRPRDGCRSATTPAALGGLAPFGAAPPAGRAVAAASAAGPRRAGCSRSRSARAPRPGRRPRRVVAPARRRPAADAALGGDDRRRAPPSCRRARRHRRPHPRRRRRCSAPRPAGPWAPTTLPGRAGDPPLLLAARAAGHRHVPGEPALRASRSTASAALGPAHGPRRGRRAARAAATGRSRYRLSQLPVVPGTSCSTSSSTATPPTPFGLAGDAATPWREVPSLRRPAPTTGVFTLDPPTGAPHLRRRRPRPRGARRLPQRRRPLLRHRRRDRRPARGRATSLHRAQHPGTSPARRCSRSPRAPRPRRRASCCVRGPARSARAAAPSPRPTTRRRARAPGADVARAHCLPADRVPGTLTVLVLPAADGARRLADPAHARRRRRCRRRPAPRRGSRRDGRRGRRRDAALPDLSPSPRCWSGGADTDLARLASEARGRIDAWLHPLTGGRRHRLAVRRHRALGRAVADAARRRPRPARAVPAVLPGRRAADLPPAPTSRWLPTSWSGRAPTCSTSVREERS